ncbi:hypothetical protein AAG906_016662 [Vitis piasezkii]
MMRGMSYLPSMGLGRRRHGSASRLSLYGALAQGESEDSADSYAFLLSCAPVHQEPSRLLSPPRRRASAPRPAVTIERRSPWPFDFCVDRSFLSRSH